MKSIDGIENINDILIEVKAGLQRDKLDKELLVRESFILWYILVEGVSCSNFTETEIEKLFKNNFEIYETYYSNDTDFNFMVGWMMNLTFWYFGSNFNEDYGNELLIKSYRNNTKNSLFKWAVRSKLNLNENEINNLKINISLRFEQFYNYGALIKEYFLDVVNTAH